MRTSLPRIGVTAAVTLAISLVACSGESVESAIDSPSASAEPAPPAATASPTLGPRPPASTAPSDGDITTVTIRNQSFGAPEITVAVGEVTFVNEDDFAHTVTEGENGLTAPDARFDLVIGAGETVQVPFNEPGDYHITCLFHAEMQLLVRAH